jgi:hypothetical protein
MPISYVRVQPVFDRVTELFSVNSPTSKTEFRFTGKGYNFTFIATG